MFVIWIDEQLYTACVKFKARGPNAARHVIFCGPLELKKCLVAFFCCCTEQCTIFVTGINNNYCRNVVRVVPSILSYSYIQLFKSNCIADVHTSTQTLLKPGEHTNSTQVRLRFTTMGKTKPVSGHL